MGAACKQKCLDQVNCEGFVSWGRDEQTHCALRRDVDVNQCDKQDGFKLYLRKDHVAQKGMPIPVPRTSADEAARKANELYNMDDNGVMLHVSDFDNKLISKYTDMSFSLVNKFAWDSENSRISIWENGCPKRSDMQPAAIIIATPEVEDIVMCYFPCDGATDMRVNRGCGIPAGTWPNI